MKIALLVAYDGTSFHGFARQRAARTVQGVLEEKLSAVLRAPTSLTGAGRTDAGVHASGQVVSLVVADPVDPSWVRERLNKWVAPEIVVRAAAAVSDGFDARFSALGREYEYRIYLADAADPFLDRFALWVRDEPSVTRMRAGARALIGKHDFSAFCRRAPGSMVRELRSIRVVRQEPGLVLKVAAQSFCHQMVRSIVGMLLEVGQSKREPEDVARALRSKDRAKAGPVAPARGLHLVRVRYRPDPFRAVAAR